MVWSEHLCLPVSEDNERTALTEISNLCDATLNRFEGTLQSDLATLAEALSQSRSSALASVRYAERRALEGSARGVTAALGELKQLEYYQERRLRGLNLTPIETEEELEALRADSARFAGRRDQMDGYEW